MNELEMYELWRTLRLWANYNQLNQTIEKNWLSNSFNSHILDLLDKEEIKYRSEKRLLGYRNKGKRRLAGNANQPIIISIDDVADIIDVRAEDEFARVELLVSLKQELERLSPRELMIIRTYLDYPIEVVARKLIYKDLRSLEKSVDDGNEESSSLDLFSLEMFENIAFIMAKHAHPDQVPDTPDEWLENFNTFSIYQILPQLIELWGLNVQTEVEARKNLAKVSG